MNKRRLMESIVAGTPVWFGCDVGQDVNNELGIWDARLFDSSPCTTCRSPFDKADRLLYGTTPDDPRHAVHRCRRRGEGMPRKPGVSRTAGATEKADKGFWTMNDNWFDEHVFEIAVPRGAARRNSCRSRGRADRAARLGPHGRLGRLRFRDGWVALVDRGRLGHRGVHQRPTSARRRPQHPALTCPSVAPAPVRAAGRLAGRRRVPPPHGRSDGLGDGHLRKPLVAAEWRTPLGVRRHPHGCDADDLDLQARCPHQPPVGGDPVGARRGSWNPHLGAGSGRL